MLALHDHLLQVQEVPQLLHLDPRLNTSDEKKKNWVPLTS